MIREIYRINVVLITMNFPENKYEGDKREGEKKIDRERKKEEDHDVLVF